MNATPNNFDDITLSMVSTITNGILSLPLNCYVVFLILRGSRRTLTTDFLSLNLALSDILTSIFAYFYVAYRMFETFAFLTAFAFFLGFLLTARPLFQFCICIEYYFGVVHPVLYLRYKHLRYKCACCCVVWLLALLSCIYNIKTFDKPVYLFTFFGQNVIISCVILYCCLTVVRALKQPGPGENATDGKKSNAAKRRAVVIIMRILISMAFSFLSLMVAIPLQCCMKVPPFLQALTIATFMAVLSGFTQPLIYLHRSGIPACFRRFRSSSGPE